MRSGPSGNALFAPERQVLGELQATEAELGVAVPLSLPLFVDFVVIQVSKASVVVAFAVSFGVGLVFGMLPANRASRLNPTEALRYE